MNTERFQDKCRGALVGGAVGDALGYPVEFVCSFKDIQAKYGKGGIREYDRQGLALFSDDTQMTLYTAEGLLAAEQGGKPTTSAPAWPARSTTEATATPPAP